MGIVYDDNVARQLVELEIKNMKEISDMISDVAEVVKRFDGKVLSKRLETALKVVNNNLRVESTNVCIHIARYRGDRCFTSSKHNTYYLDNMYDYMTVYSDSFDDKGKINADAIIESLNIKREKIIRRIKDLQDSLNRIDEWRDKINKAKEELKNLRKEIPSEILSYYNGFDMYHIW